MYIEELVEEKENLEHQLEFAEFDLRLNNNEFTRSKVAYLQQRLANTKRAINRTKQMVKPIYCESENLVKKQSKLSKWYYGELSGWYDKLMFFICVGFGVAIIVAFIIWLFTN